MLSINRKMFLTDGIAVYKYNPEYDDYDYIKDEEVVRLLNYYHEEKLAWENRGVKREGKLFNTEQMLINTEVDKVIYIGDLVHDLGFADNYGHGEALRRQGEVLINGLPVTPDMETFPVGDVVFNDLTIEVGKTLKATLQLDKTYDPKDKKHLKIILIKREENGKI